MKCSPVPTRTHVSGGVGCNRRFFSAVLRRSRLRRANSFTDPDPVGYGAEGAPNPPYRAGALPLLHAEHVAQAETQQEQEDCRQDGLNR